MVSPPFFHRTPFTLPVKPSSDPDTSTPPRPRKRAVRVLLKILRDGASPVMAKVAIPALVRGDELITESGLLGGFIRRAQALEVGDDRDLARVFPSPR